MKLTNQQIVERMRKSENSQKQIQRMEVISLPSSFLPKENKPYILLLKRMGYEKLFLAIDTVSASASLYCSEIEMETNHSQSRNIEIYQIDLLNYRGDNNVKAVNR
jgi:hypothetical protein